MPNTHTAKLTIVKVQLPVATTGSPEQMLIYDKSRRYQVEVQASKQPEAYKLMADTGEMKAFMYANLVNKVWIIDVAAGFAPWQDW
jgi:hypothetical protein